MQSPYFPEQPVLSWSLIVREGKRDACVLNEINVETTKAFREEGAIPSCPTVQRLRSRVKRRGRENGVG